MDTSKQIELFLANGGQITRLPARGKARKNVTEVVADGSDCRSCKTKVHKRIIPGVNNAAVFDRGCYMSCLCGRLTWSPSEGRTRYRLEAFGS